MIKKSLYIFVCIFLTHCTITQIENTNNLSNTFNWDLSYESILKRNNIAQDEFLSKWNKSTRKELPIKQILSKWDKEPIKTSILVESPDFHAGKQLAHWFIGTSNSAYLWQIRDGKIYEDEGRIIDFNHYNSVLKTVSGWEQGPPFNDIRAKKIAAKIKERMPLGYIGFLSIYNHGVSKQILLSIEDYYNFENSADEEDFIGRIKTFQSLIESKK